MSLDPEIKKMLDETSKMGLAPLFDLSVSDARQRMRDTHVNQSGHTPVYYIETQMIPCDDHVIPIRIYYPSAADNLPCLLFFHGGGWTVNDLDTHEELCRSLTRDVGSVVISVDFRRAPEFKYPVQIEDSYAALKWVSKNGKKLKINPRKLAVGGDSSGANQATVVCLLSRDRSGPKILFQWLAYPVTDYHTPSTISYEEMAEGYSLSKKAMVWFWNNYLPASFDRENPYLFPMRSKDLSNLPPTLLLTANFDPLRDEGEAYGKKLEEAGNSIKLKRHEDQMHSFLLIKGKIESANRAYLEAVAELIMLFNIK